MPKVPAPIARLVDAVVIAIAVVGSGAACSLPGQHTYAVRAPQNPLVGAQELYTSGLSVDSADVSLAGGAEHVKLDAFRDTVIPHWKETGESSVFVDFFKSLAPAGDRSATDLAATLGLASRTLSEKFDAEMKIATPVRLVFGAAPAGALVFTPKLEVLTLFQRIGRGDIDVVSNAQVAGILTRAGDDTVLEKVLVPNASARVSEVCNGDAVCIGANLADFLCRYIDHRRAGGE